MLSGWEYRLRTKTKVKISSKTRKTGMLYRENYYNTSWRFRALYSCTEWQYDVGRQRK
jgi:hypothetical protein